MTTTTLPTRRAYAQAILAEAGLTDDRLQAAFAAVPRERHLPPGPWMMAGGKGPYRSGFARTPDDNPDHVYGNYVIALDPDRGINNGEPTLHAQMLAVIDPQAGATVAHVGAGLGYYSAILAELVGPEGRVFAYEVVPSLARSAREALSGYPNVTVRESTGHDLAANSVDAVYVNAGATKIAEDWVTALKDGGHLIMPLTVDPASLASSGWIGRNRLSRRWGAILHVRRRGSRYAAEVTLPVAFVGCVGLRDAQSETRLAEAVAKGQMKRVRSLLLGEADPKDPDCCLAGDGWWLSAAAP